MTDTWTLKTLFDLVDYPKEESMPPHSAKVLAAFNGDDYLQAARFLKKKLPAAKGTTFTRCLYYFEIGDRQRIELIEIKLFNTKGKR